MKVLLLLCLAGLAMAFPVPGNTGKGKPVPREGLLKKVAEDRKYAPAPPKYSPNKRSAPEKPLEEEITGEKFDWDQFNDILLQTLKVFVPVKQQN